jgi:Flp pilus assembly secretin CpaC
VSRSALTELGVNFFTSPTGVKNTLARTTTQQFPAPGFSDIEYTKNSSDFGADVTSAKGKFTFSDFLNLFLFSEKYDIGANIRLLQERGLFQSLAEPNLVAESGKEASFLAGGEIPIPIAQPGQGGVSITVQYKEFGIRLNFTPVVNGDRVHLKVRPEVSSLDFNNAVTLQGFRIPALTTRRTETELELENKQTFAIAGLLNNTMNQSLQKIPGIGDVPILGLLFKSKAAQKNNTELVVMITPEILPTGSKGVTSSLPRITEPFLAPASDKKTMDAPPPAFSTPSAAAPAASQPVAAPAPVQQPAANAAPRPTAPAAQQPAPAAQEPPAAKTSKADEEKAAKAQLKATSEREAKAAEEEKRKAEAEKKASAETQKQAAEQKKRDDKAAREQAKKDAEAAKRQAAIEKAAADAAAKRAAEDAKKQQEVDKRNQKSVDDAEARLKAAQAVYQAELAKRGSRH